MGQSSRLHDSSKSQGALGVAPPVAPKGGVEMFSFSSSSKNTTRALAAAAAAAFVAGGLFVRPAPAADVVYAPTGGGALKQYVKDTTARTWTDAEANAISLGGHLASIGSAQ